MRPDTYKARHAELHASLSLFESLPTSQHPRERDRPQQPKGITRALDTILEDGKPWTVKALAAVLQRRGYRFTESGLTARLRDLRKSPFSRVLEVSTAADGASLYSVVRS